MTSRNRILALLAALTLFASACGSSAEDEAAVATADEVADEVTDDESSGDDETSDDDNAGEVAADDAAAPADANAINGGKPVVEVAGGDSPAELVIEDIIEGDGAVAAAGDLLVMHYVGVLFDDGSQFDASWDRGDTFTFVLGNGNVIQGWDEGIEGMAVGGRRELTIPAEFAYGDNSPSPDIPPGSTLVFVVDLVAAYTPHDVDTATENETELEVSVVSEGTGPEVVPGDLVEVTYSLAEPNGAIIQSSWTDGSTAIFTVGGDQPEIFEGWNEPLVGSNVGDELRIVVPADLGPNPEGEGAAVTQLTVIGVIDPT